MEEKKNLPELIKQVTNGVDLKIAEMQVRSERANNALKAIVAITTDEEDAAAEAVLVKVRTTYDKAKALRMEITGPLDEAKKLLMAPEKLITNEPGADNEYSRVKKLRDAHANKKVADENKRIAAIKKTQDIETEKVRIKAACEAAVDMGIINAVRTLSQNVKASFEAITLETIDNLAVKLSKDSNLKQEVYDSWFLPIVSFNPLLVSAEDVTSIKSAVKAVKTFEIAAAKYKEDAKVELETWSDKIPAIRESLSKSKEAAAEAIAEASKQSDATAAAKTQEAQSNAKSSLESQTMGVAFQAQMGMQTGAATISGKKVKKAVIDSCGEDFVVTMSALFFAVFTHPKYTGVIKTDSKKMQQFNEDGTPIYVDWLEGLLTFYANNCSQKINHIVITETVSTTQKKK